MKFGECDKKIKALALVVGESTRWSYEDVASHYENPFTYCSYNSDLIEYGEQEYLVLAEDEKEDALFERIIEDLWAFNASWLSSMTGLNQEVFESLQDQCESANPAVLALIKSTCGLEKFIEESVSCDGAGHFLAQYDHNEEEIDVNNIYYYIYRVN